MYIYVCMYVCMYEIISNGKHAFVLRFDCMNLSNLESSTCVTQAVKSSSVKIR